MKCNTIGKNWKGENVMLGFILGLMICFGIRAVMRLIIKDEASADEATFILILAILATILIFIYIF